ncbi:hypothetical protein ABZP36_028035 [Zizania latifolia]
MLRSKAEELRLRLRGRSHVRSSAASCGAEYCPSSASPASANAASTKAHANPNTVDAVSTSAGNVPMPSPPPLAPSPPARGVPTTPTPSPSCASASPVAYGFVSAALATAVGVLLLVQPRDLGGRGRRRGDPARSRGRADLLLRRQGAAPPAVIVPGFRRYAYILTYHLVASKLACKFTNIQHAHGCFTRPCYVTGTSCGSARHVTYGR